jgi:hypothetical protein
METSRDCITVVGCQVFVAHSLRSLSALEEILNEGDEKLGDHQTSESRRVIVGERSEQALAPVRQGGAGIEKKDPGSIFLLRRLHLD